MTPQEVEVLVEQKMAPIRAKLQEDSEKLDKILQLLAKFEGAGTLMKLLFLGVAPLFGLMLWAKDHIKL